MPQNILTEAITIGATALIFAWLMKSRGAADKKIDGTLVLAYAKAWRILVYVFVFIPIAIFLIADRFPPKPEDQWIPGAMALGFTVLIAPLAWEVLRFRVEMNSFEITRYSGWVKPKLIPWTDVASLTYNPGAQWYVITGRDGRKIRIPQYASGIDDLKEQFTKRGYTVPTTRETRL